jgi:hypothetical protein
MKPVVSIAKPCHESWERMTPEEQGRFCGQCCKVVVDFTSMNENQIVDYLSRNREQRVCGRFRTEQVKSPRIRFQFNVQRFAAALMLVFGSLLFTSCSGIKPGGGHEVMGDVAYVPDTVPGPNPQTRINNDSVQPELHMLGEAVAIPDTVK